jgi:hypothetical protein
MISPVILGLLPMIHVSNAIETALIVTSIAIGVLTVGAGYREHRRLRVVVLLALSLVLLVARFFVAERFETATVIAGAMLMAAAQFLNLRLQKHCCDHDHTRRSELSSIARRV